MKRNMSTASHMRNTMGTKGQKISQSISFVHFKSNKKGTRSFFLDDYMKSNTRVARHRRGMAGTKDQKIRQGVSFLNFFFW